jgi:hypothetical protein
MAGRAPQYFRCGLYSAWGELSLPSWRNLGNPQQKAIRGTVLDLAETTMLGARYLAWRHEDRQW